MKTLTLEEIDYILNEIDKKDEIEFEFDGQEFFCEPKEKYFDATKFGVRDGNSYSSYKIDEVIQFK